MSVKINPPAKRSLNPMEQKVYNLLHEGLEPPEIAKKLRIAEKSGHCITITAYPENLPYSVMDLICGIREKGWEIPGEKFSNKNEEEVEMAKGVKHPPETLERVMALRNEGKTYKEIEEITGVKPNTAMKWRSKAKAKEKPAPAATDAGSDGKSTPKNSDTKIIAENSGDVKSPDEKFSDITLDVLREEIKHRIFHLGELRKSIQQEKDELQPLMDDFEKMGGKMR